MNKNCQTLNISVFFIIIELDYVGFGGKCVKLEEVLDTAILVGYNLLRNGAEIYRVEQSIVYICTAYGMQEIEAFAIP